MSNALHTHADVTLSVTLYPSFIAAAKWTYDGIDMYDARLTEW